jgi:hypothetical protein
MYAFIVLQATTMRCHDPINVDNSKKKTRNRAHMHGIVHSPEKRGVWHRFPRHTQAQLTGNNNHKLKETTFKQFATLT